jgi:hypothetical protein
MRSSPWKAGVGRESGAMGGCSSGAHRNSELAARAVADTEPIQRLIQWSRCSKVQTKPHLWVACTDLDTADTTRGLLGITLVAADLPEAWRLWETINDWWDEIEIFIETRVTNARAEAANPAIKHIKRTGRGYRNRRRYQARILLRSHRQTHRRRTRLNAVHA